MNTALSLVLLLSFPVEVVRPEAPREPNPFAPSLPLLTKEEEEKLDQIVERFIQYDIGQLKGAEGKQALADFQKLGPESVFALIRGLNRAAAIESSCPAVVIGKKLNSLLGRSQDTELLEFARENMGAGITRSRHLGIIKDLRTLCIVRKRQVLDYQLAVQRFLASKSPGEMTLVQLNHLTTQLKGKELKPILEELARRNDPQVVGSLANAAASYDPNARALGQEYLGTFLARQDADYLKKALKDARPLIRGLAAQTIGVKKLPLGDELIAALGDSNTFAQQSARKALQQLAGPGTDFGPEPGGNSASLEVSQGLWRDWLSKQKK